MEAYISLSNLKTLVEKKIKKKVLVKVMWNETEKITLFITPNLKINSFIYDQKEGYLFYDNEGKVVEKLIPCILPEENLTDGKVVLEGSKGGKIRINNQHLSKEDISFLRG